MLTKRFFDPFSLFDKKDSFFSFFNDIYQSTNGLDYKKEDNGSYLLTIDVPGIKEEDLNIELSEDNVLMVKGERKTKTSTYLVQKSFYVGDNIDSDSIKAELKDGVLTVSLSQKPLPQSKEVKKIPISTSK